MTWPAVAALGTVCSMLLAALSLWWAIGRRPAPDWLVTGWLRESGSGDQRTLVLERATLINVGDGHGYQVKVSASPDEVGAVMFDRPSRSKPSNAVLMLMPVLRSGEEWPLLVRCPPHLRDKAEIIIEWTSPPTRRRWKAKRPETRRFPIAAIDDAARVAVRPRG